MYKILSSKESMDSAMKLRDAIIAVLGMPEGSIKVSKDSGNCAGHTVIMRYGCSYGTLEKEPVWGGKKFSAICINKEAFSNTFGHVITTPIFHRNDFPQTFPVLIRETLTGSKSEGIKIAHNAQEFLAAWKQGYVWTPYFAHTMELRVYAVFLGETIKIRIYKKVPRDEVVSESADEFICGQDGADNTKWVLRDNSAYSKVKRILEKMHPVVRDLEGMFVGLDMIYVPELQDYVTLEGNSGPWLTLSTATWLAKIFNESHGGQLG